MENIPDASVPMPNPLVTIEAGHVVTTSQDVARVFGKLHKNVVRDIRKILEEVPEEHRLNFEPMFDTVETGQGAKLAVPGYRITRDGFTLLAMGFTGSKALTFKLAYIAAFNRMEAYIRGGGGNSPPILSPDDRLRLDARIDLRLAAVRAESDPEMQQFQYDRLSQFTAELGLTLPSLEKLLTAPRLVGRSRSTPPEQVSAAAAFWQVVRTLEAKGVRINHSHNAGRYCALHLTSLRKAAAAAGLVLNIEPATKDALRELASPSFLEQKTIRSAITEQALHCWVFRQDGGRAV